MTTDPTCCCGLTLVATSGAPDFPGDEHSTDPAVLRGQTMTYGCPEHEGDYDVDRVIKERDVLLDERDTLEAELRELRQAIRALHKHACER